MSRNTSSSVKPANVSTTAIVSDVSACRVCVVRRWTASMRRTAKLLPTQLAQAQRIVHAECHDRLQQRKHDLVLRFKGGLFLP